MEEAKQPARTQSASNTPVPEWANPTPAGLVALAVACFCFFALLNGFVETSALPLIGCWLIGGFVIQVIVALLDLKNKNFVGGNTFLFFSGFFMLAGGLEMFVKYHGVLTGVPVDARIDGWAWLALAIVVLLWTPAFMKPFSLLSLIVLTLNVALPFIVVLDLGILPMTWAPVPAYALLVAGCLGIYLSAAMIVNGALGKTFYPVIGPRTPKK
ncbi:MAG: hypothetical protein FWG78_02925 [Coriobacteriia bacterium]|nr:hypothetical protein [Coriobacteriia bacterium]